MKIFKEHLKESGNIPNNERLPLMHYKGAFELKKSNPSSIIKKTFLENHWYRPWVNGIYSYQHYHSNNHEVMGIAEGECTVILGGPEGVILNLKKGDALILPAGTAHKRLNCTNDFSCVGAYSLDADYNMRYCKKAELSAAKNKIRELSVPHTDPVFGENGPLLKYWN